MRCHKDRTSLVDVDSSDFKDGGLSSFAFFCLKVKVLDKTVNPQVSKGKFGKFLKSFYT